MIEIQLFLTILKRCQFCLVHFQSSLWNDVRFDIFSAVLCCSNANKINKQINTKAFVLVTIFWQTCCIF